MNKKILLIGNTNGLPGVNVDLTNYKEYFMSNKGGQWYEREFIKCVNPSKSDLLQELDNLKELNLDFLIVIYSGHGGHKRETILEINSDHEYISETRLFNISEKQIIIFDCCRAKIESLILSEKFEKSYSKFAEFGKSYRQKYEERITSALPQQIKMYSCSVGEYSIDTAEGGLYTKCLIKSAINDSSEYILVGNIHQKAAELTHEINNDQNPNIEIPRLMSQQQLIFGVN